MNKANTEKTKLADSVSAALVNPAESRERVGLEGVYTAHRFDIVGPDKEALTKALMQALLADDTEMVYVERLDAELRLPRDPYWQRRVSDGYEKVWWDKFCNIVTTVGADQMFDEYFAGSAFTPAIYMGLAGATPTPAQADTQASHAGWTEVGGANAPAYSGTRKTPAWSAASARAKAVSPAVNFTFTSSGTVGGAFLNQGGSSAQDNTTGTLFSCAAFTGGNQVVVSTTQINVSWSISTT